MDRGNYFLKARDFPGAVKSFVSYNKEIHPVELENGFKWYTGYDHVLDGSIISSFIEAVAKFSDYDISEIRSMVNKKYDWYH